MRLFDDSRAVAPARYLNSMDVGLLLASLLLCCGAGAAPVL